MSAPVHSLEMGMDDRRAEPSPRSPHSSKPARVLACILCQQRKVRCDRKFPCANCIKSRVQCVPATLLQRRRRRRFPGRELLERLRGYEDLLRRNNIPFEPLHQDPSLGKRVPNTESGDDSHDEHADMEVASMPTPSSIIRHEGNFEAKNIWHAMSQGFRDPNNDSDSSDDGVREIAIRKAWDQTGENDDQLLFGAHRANADLSALHPDPVQIFRLWQVYLDNVNPLLRVIHTPSLQGRIIEAASNVTSIRSTTEALMFSIYCVALITLTTEECQSIFSTSKEDLLTRYQSGCQQALWNSGFLRSTDRECLTALYLYLISVRSSILPQSLSSILGVAVRVAQRMGIHSEAALSKCDILEAEMRRRLWWSLVLFDARVGEMASWKSQTLDPTWDCKSPLNVNDSDLRLDMKGLPAVQNKTSEALFVVVRSELADFVRHSSFHLDFTSPILKPIAQHLRSLGTSEQSGLIKLEEMIETQYLRFCDQENPVQFMTVWTARAHLAKSRLIQHHATFSSATSQQTEADRDTATSHALRLLECDTKIMTSPLTKGFLWLNHLYFPFPAYNQVVQDLRKRPLCERATYAWEIMSHNYKAWFESRFQSMNTPVFRMFSKMILQGWEASKTAFDQSGQVQATPTIVSSIKYALAQKTQLEKDVNMVESDNVVDLDFDDFAIPISTPTAMNYSNQDFPHQLGPEAEHPITGPSTFSAALGYDQAHPYVYHWGGVPLQGWPGWNGY